MWRTSSGERTLVGPEAALIRAALDQMLDTIRVNDEIDENSTWGIPLFDCLEQAQKITLLAYVAEALLREGVKPPPLTAINEAAVGAIYITIEHAIDFEIDSEDDLPSEYRCYWRQLVLTASDLENWPADDPPPAPECRDRSEWQCLVEAIADSVLWDDDWLADGFVMDVDPETAAFRKKKLGIADDYYLAVAPDPTSEQVEKARETLRRLTAE